MEGLMTPKLKNKVSMNIVECYGQGVSVKTVLDGFKKMKAELEALGCEVTMNIDGKPLEAFSVVEMLESETVK
jgi:hypothetical protein